MAGINDRGEIRMKYPRNVTDHRAVEKMMDLLDVEEIVNGNARITMSDTDEVVLVGFYAETHDDDQKMVAWKYEMDYECDMVWKKTDFEPHSGLI